MKKIALLAGMVVLTGCSTYHTGRTGTNIIDPEIRYVPKQAEISIDSANKVSGNAKCSSVLWVLNDVPTRQLYGPKLAVSSGNFASDECVAAAMYDAIGTSGADILVNPQYTATRDGVLCFGYRCLFGTTNIIVNGYAGHITSITDMDATVVKEKFKSDKGSSSISLPSLF